MTFPSPFPTPVLPLFEIDFGALFNSVLIYVQAARRLRSQPPLVPDNAFLIGQESLPNYTSAPAIWIVPRGFKYKSVRRIQDEPSETPFFSQWLLLECHCWGDDHPDPNANTTTYSFSTATELARQLVMGFVEAAKGGQVARGEAHTIIESTEFRQRTDVNRQGRVLVMNLAQETFLVRDPPIFVPVATPTTPGVQAEITFAMGQPPPGQSETAGSVLVPTGSNG